MELNRHDLIDKAITEIRLLRPDTTDVVLAADTALWSDNGPGSASCIDLDSLDLLELLIIFEEDHGLRMPDDLDDLAPEELTVGGLVDLLIAESAKH